MLSTISHINTIWQFFHLLFCSSGTKSMPAVTAFKPHRAASQKGGSTTNKE